MQAHPRIPLLRARWPVGCTLPFTSLKYIGGRFILKPRQDFHCITSISIDVTQVPSNPRCVCLLCIHFNRCHSGPLKSTLCVLVTPVCHQTSVEKDASQVLAALPDTCRRGFSLLLHNRWHKRPSSPSMWTTRIYDRPKVRW